MRKLGLLLFVVALVLSFALVPATPVVAAPVIAGLWHLDGDANDDSGNGNDATLSGAPAWVADQWGGQALNFDGLDDYGTVSHSDTLDMTGAYALEAWVNATDDLLPNKYRPILFRGATNANDIEVYIQAASKDLIVAHNRGNGGTFDYVGFADPPLGTWFHLAVIFDGTNVQAYYNGAPATVVQLTTAVAAPLDTNKGWWIGKVDHSAFNYLGSGNLHYFKGILDEVRIWNTATPSFNLTAAPAIGFNPVNTNHTVTATVTIEKVSGGTEPAPGVLVDFAVSGQNSDTGSDYSDNNGVATFTYTGDGGDGKDTINASLNYSFYQATDAVVEKYWLENFVTGGGKIGGNKATWTFAGTVGNLEGGSVGQFQIVDHANKISYHCNNNFSFLNFRGPEATSPVASHNTAIFIGVFTGNVGPSRTFTIIIQDLGEPGAGVDKIQVREGTTDILPQTAISGGNFQVHDIP